MRLTFLGMLCLLGLSANHDTSVRGCQNEGRLVLVQLSSVAGEERKISCYLELNINQIGLSSSTNFSPKAEDTVKKISTSCMNVTVKAFFIPYRIRKNRFAMLISKNTITKISQRAATPY